MQRLITRLLGRGVLAALAMALAACGDNSSSSASNNAGTANVPKQPLLLVVIVDPTDSASAERKQWVASFEQLVSNHLPEDAQVVFIHAEHQPKLGRSLRYDGNRASAQQIYQAFVEALQPIPCGKDAQGRDLYSGTDIVGALREAVAYAAKPENAHFERKLIIGWSDLIADPSKCNGEVKTYDPPTAYTPPDSAKEVELVLHGIDEERGRVSEKVQALRQQWEDKFKRLGLYHRGEQVQIERHYNLKKRETLY